MSASPLRVVIAGGGVAGLETLIALRDLAADRVALTLVAPEDEFVYRPLSVEEPHGVGRMRRVALESAATQAGAVFVPGMVERVHPEARSVTVPSLRPLAYDALVLAVGAEPMPAVEHALTWDDRSDSELIGGLLADVEQGYSRRVAVVIPPGPGWPLRGYELALLIARDVRGAGADVETTLVAPEPSPLALLGPGVLEEVTGALEASGVAIVSGERADVEQGRPAAVVLQPSGRRVEVDRVLALPVLRGRRIGGVPADADGFAEVDEHCRVRGLERVWAAGDNTAFAVKSGAVAAEQADAVAADIAALAGAEIEPRQFDPAVPRGIGGLPSGRHLAAWLAAGDDALTTHLPPDGVPILTYLQRDLAAGWRGYG